MSQHIKNIVFDLGGVLIDWNPVYLYRKLFDQEDEMHTFLEKVCPYSWNLQQDAGRTWKEAIAERVELYPEYEPQIKAYFERWPEMLGGAMAATVAILKELKEQDQYRLLALTNWSAETFPFAQERFEFLNWFEGIVVSGVEKTRKPAEDIYQILFERYAIQPNESVFIDDSQPNIDTAIRLGMHGIHFQSAEALKTELKSLLG